MHPERLAIVQGWGDTRAALRRWNTRPGPVVGPWLLGSLAVAVALLLATWAIALVSTPDLTHVGLAGVGAPATEGDYLFILYRNGLVLALHAMACVAGFIAGSSLPLQAEHRHGISRVIHQHGGRVAIVFVSCATMFSLSTQAYLIGHTLAGVSDTLEASPAVLLQGVLPHALPELVALFLPLAAWIIASRRGEWEQLLAATLVTVAIAVPVLAIAAFVEVYVSPHLMSALTHAHPVVVHPQDGPGRIALVR